MTILALTVLVLLPALILAGLARSVYSRGAFTEIASWWRGASRPMKAGTSGLILESDKVLFEPDGNCRKRITCDSDNNSTFSFFGDIPSTEMNDATIALKTLSGETLVSTNLTVLGVEISMRCGQGERQSPDNGMTAGVGTIRLGKQKTAGIYLPNSIHNAVAAVANIVEFRGAVYPSSFCDEVVFSRDCIDEYSLVLNPNGTIASQCSCKIVLGGPNQGEMTITYPIFKIEILIHTVTYMMLILQALYCQVL